MKRFALYLATLFLAASFATASVSAINVFNDCSGANANTDICKATTNDNATSMMKSVINTILMVLGIVAVIVIVIGGVRYTTSQGDSNSTKAAKDTILYAVIGLVVAILAYAVVNFVVGKLM